MKIDMTLFEDYQIRRIYDEEAEIWWFSVIDIVQVLTQQPNQQTARKYWNKLKQRLTAEGSELVTNCHRLKLPAAAADSDHYQHVKLDARIIMPNHIHGIIMLDTVVRAQQKEASCENG